MSNIRCLKNRLSRLADGKDNRPKLTHIERVFCEPNWDSNGKLLPPIKTGVMVREIKPWPCDLDDDDTAT